MPSAPQWQCGSGRLQHQRLQLAWKLPPNDNGHLRIPTIAKTNLALTYMACVVESKLGLRGTVGPVGHSSHPSQRQKQRKSNPNIWRARVQLGVPSATTNMFKKEILSLVFVFARAASRQTHQIAVLRATARARKRNIPSVAFAFARDASKVRRRLNAFIA